MPEPARDTFEDAITRFRNRSIHAYVGHCLLFRGQVLQNGEFGTQSGWDTATNDFLKEHLLRLDFLRRKGRALVPELLQHEVTGLGHDLQPGVR